MSTCGHIWKAPYLHAPPSKKVTSVTQKCSLPKGHDGPHRSLSGVITSDGGGAK